GFKDKQIVSVKVGAGTGRAVVFGDVVVRVSDKYAPAMHIDTDESKAAGLTGTVDGEIIV
ncbi:MAG: propanediol utilization protein, partial [Ruminococcus sp.]|nr:propanediol utilization protein [Ruminococcus sp.]